MNKVQLIDLLVDKAKKYRVDAQESVTRNIHMNELWEGEQVRQKHIDAVLVDFINFIGMEMCMDTGLYTVDIKTNEKP